MLSFDTDEMMLLWATSDTLAVDPTNLAVGMTCQRLLEANYGTLISTARYCLIRGSYHEVPRFLEPIAAVNGREIASQINGDCAGQLSIDRATEWNESASRIYVEVILGDHPDQRNRCHKGGNKTRMTSVATMFK